MKKLLLTIVMSFLISTAGGATTFYVATNGSDSNTCTQAQSTSTPKRSISGSSGGISCLSAGSTLYIRAGNYAELIASYNTSIPSGTSWTNAVTIAGYPGETVVIMGNSSNAVDFSAGSGISYVIFRDFVLNLSSNALGAYLGSGVNHIRFHNIEVKSSYVGGDSTTSNSLGFQGGGTFIEVLNCNIHNLSNYGFYVFGQNWLIEGNRIHDNAGYGIQVYNSGHSDVSNNTVSNNVIYANGGGYRVLTGGLILASGSNNLAYNNIFYGHKDGGASVQIGYTNGGTNNRLYNNIVYGGQGPGINVDSSASGSQVKNNIVYNNNGGGITNSSASTTFANNLCGAAGTGCAYVGDPNFVDPAGRDFHLQSTSPAINKGVTLTEFSTDIDGNSRPQGIAWDIGAGEYLSGGNSAPPSNLRIIY